ncbi:MAG: hypothetical protein IPP69_02885 [Flavobacteriales bacterium]|nr:hypothetical protein [Flavobacteriales bacterium]
MKIGKGIGKIWRAIRGAFRRSADEVAEVTVDAAEYGKVIDDLEPGAMPSGSADEVVDTGAEMATGAVQFTQRTADDLVISLKINMVEMQL